MPNTIPDEFAQCIRDRWDFFLVADVKEKDRASQELSPYTRGFKTLDLLKVIPPRDQEAFKTWLVYAEVQKDGSRGR